MNVLKKTFHFAFLILFYLVSIVAITTVASDCYWAGILAFPLMLLVVYLCAKYHKSGSIKVSKWIWPALQCLSIVLMLYLAFTLEVSYSWDWGQLSRTAYECAQGNDISLIEYYARYPNNRFWLAVLTTLFKAVNRFSGGASLELCKHVSMVFSVLLTQLTALVVYKTAQKLWSPGKALFIGCITLAFLPFYLYAQFAYTDAPAMLLIACTIYCYVQYKRSNDCKIAPYIFAAFIGILTALLYQIKIMGLIVPIAILIDAALNIGSWKKAKTALIALVVVAIPLASTIGITNLINNRMVPISEELSETYEFPFTHWVMMGLGKSGGYDQNDVDFTKSFDTYDAKSDATIAKIKDRIADRGILGTAKHLLITKTARTWGNDNLAGSDYTNRGTLKTDTLAYEVLTLGGHKQFIREIYTGIYHIFMIVGILLAAISALRKKKEDPLLFVRIAVFGVILFMMLWECNSRYLLIVSPLLLLCGYDGWLNSIQWIKKKRGVIK